MLYHGLITCMSITPGIIGTVMPILLHHCTKLAKILTSKKNCVIIKLAPTSTWNQDKWLACCSEEPMCKTIDFLWHMYINDMTCL